MDLASLVLGIDIGGTSIKIGIVHNCEVIESQSIRNVFKGKYDDLIPGIKPICDAYIKKYKICKIGVGCPGDIIDGVVVFASNLGWKNYHILEDFQKNFPECEIKIENDGKAACQAEIKYGALKNVSHGILITIGRGVGGEIISNSQLIHGAYQNGGRIGHIVIQKNGRRCNCGRRGCFESYASVLGLIQTIKEINFHWQNEQEKIDVEKLSGVQIVQYKKNNSIVVKEGLKKWHKDICEGLLNLCMIFDPEVIVIAGGITDSGLVDINLLQEIISKKGYSNCQIVLSKFKGKTGIIGASALVK